MQGVFYLFVKQACNINLGNEYKVGVLSMKPY